MMKSKKLMQGVVLGLCVSSLVLLDGCVVVARKATANDGNAVPTSNATYSPTKASQVKIYQAQPAHAQIIGRVSADNENKLGVEHSHKSIMEELQKQAASLGANGIMNVMSNTTTTTADAILVQK